MGHHREHRERDEHGRTVRSRTSQETGQAASYMEMLAQALRAGGVTVRSGARLVALRTADRLDLELEAGEEGRYSVVRLLLRWETPTPEERLDITPGVPDQPAAAAADSATSAPGQEGGAAGGSGGSRPLSSRRSGPGSGGGLTPAGVNPTPEG